ncbi:2-phospho-L-lactate transferase [Sphingomonas sp. LaA6.9]|uniref:2-phospho-L-lactate transferase n=1 Tax=Sphingomonas sp. LaA6.9 TaxID=2919914 RepID=UPI001F50369B|nr:2-phospho-L-lactate transferase [Sphingomonas sp. LaA6.9]MCJ8156124.1 2-phospho-L-lactate transferase [Sphingomonas sp. LaA6.9]
MKVTVLSGGVGGAKFVLGLQHCEEVDQLTAIVNTGDDFRHLGMHISPDIDTLLYTLSGQANATQGWGREGESWNFMAALKALGGPDWFNLGDGDLALHVLRTQRIEQGHSLSVVTADLAKAWGIGASVLPMSDDTVATWLETDEGALPFQSYFVERQCRPITSAIRFEGAVDARPAPGVLQSLADADAVFIAPSNPWLSVDPVLAVPGIADALRETSAPVIAISPLVGGKAVKGPTTKLMAELGINADNEAIAGHYAGLISGLLHDSADAPPLSTPARSTATLMTSLDDKVRVARAAIVFAEALKA